MNHGKNAIKVGDVLYGYYCGLFGGDRHPTFSSFEVAKVGNKYLYDRLGYRYHIIFDKKSCPRFNDPIAKDEDPNHCYRYYQSREAAERAFRARKLKFALGNFNFHGIADDKIFKIAEILGLEDQR